MKYKCYWTEFHNFEAVIEVPESLKLSEEYLKNPLCVHALIELVSAQRTDLDPPKAYEINVDWDSIWVEKVEGPTKLPVRQSD